MGRRRTRQFIISLDWRSRLLWIEKHLNDRTYAPSYATHRWCNWISGFLFGWPTQSVANLTAHSLTPTQQTAKVSAMHIPTPEELLRGYRSWMANDSLTIANWPPSHEKTGYQQSIIYDRLCDIRRDVEAIRVCMPPYILCDVFLLTKPVPPKHEWLSQSFIEIADTLVTEISC